MATGQNPGAREALETSQTKFPDCPETVDRLYQLSLRENDVESAKQHAARLVELTPDRVNGYMRSARAYFLDDQPQTAEEFLKTAVKLGASPERVKLLRRSVVARRNLPKASAEMKKALESEPLKSRLIDRDRLQPFLSDRLNGPAGFFAGRMGRVEGRIVGHILSARPINADLYEQGELNAGITPRNADTFAQFGQIYFEASKNMDLLGVVGFENELTLLKTLDNPHLTKNGWYNPLDLIAFRGVDRHAFEPWTLSLRGKKVLVVHVFDASIQQQYKNRKNINVIKDIIPDFQLKTYKPAQTSASRNVGKNWMDEYHRMREDLAAIDFDVALIGCGAYSVPLASDLRLRNKKVLVLGGAIQTLFGIIGRRWEEHYTRAGILGDGWVRPAPEERPDLADKVERGCYW
ncbi:tetratricopeptide repeat protein [Kordiimonas aestuarii]|uniref:tetratricopeptide repeat protein n=1 Tax=Kordiimonas aestuarii TaxID=1005925 RepID=UPI0021CFE449|nr:hypothetical protein [Kordiimonas aestuarii]